MKLIDDRRDRADGLIMVTHLEITDKFPTYFLKKEMDPKGYISELLKGEAIHFDLENKTYQRIPDVTVDW